MSRVISRCGFMRKFTPNLRLRFGALALGVSLYLPLLTAYPQTVSDVAQQGPAADSKVRVAYVPRATTPNTVDSAILPAPSSLDIPLLIRDSDRLGTAMHSRLPEYTYVQTRLSRELNQRGKMVEHVSEYEAYPIMVLGHHRHIVSMISENGAMISRKRLNKERQQAAKEIETAERESALQPGGAPATEIGRYVTAGIGVSQFGDGVWVGVSQFLRQCRFGAPRYERLADRDVIALNIETCAVNANDPSEQYLAKMAGVVWIDAADKVVARLEAWPAVETKQKIPSTPSDSETLIYEQTRLSNGLWVPKRIRLNAIGKAAYFNGTDKDMTFEFSHYQRFSAEANDLQQVTLKSKP